MRRSFAAFATGAIASAGLSIGSTRIYRPWIATTIVAWRRKCICIEPSNLLGYIRLHTIREGPVFPRGLDEHDHDIARIKPRIALEVADQRRQQIALELHAAAQREQDFDQHEP